jgi:23S rRNA (cytidine1920-2'-O)/16S rRNA (cytidine1409-2'-O)-methyltransferase
LDDRKKRLDVLVHDLGLTESREVARKLILAGEVRVAGQVVGHPSHLVSPTSDVEVAKPPPYVSRGGLKLAHALAAFRLDVRGLVMLDVGASTGGFTDVLLQREAGHIYAVDVGSGQLAWKLRQDTRVTTLDRTNIRFLESVPRPVNAAVVDVSFISLTMVLGPVLRLLTAEAWLVVLIKPQFEAGRNQVGRGGVVRDPAVHRQVVERVLRWTGEHGLSVGGCTPSPILGPAGNREFLALLRRDQDGVSVEEALTECFRGAHVDH